jgi:hypothetical protein
MNARSNRPRWYLSGSERHEADRLSALNERCHAAFNGSLSARAAGPSIGGRSCDFSKYCRHGKRSVAKSAHVEYATFQARLSYATQNTAHIGTNCRHPAKRALIISDYSLQRPDVARRPAMTVIRLVFWLSVMATIIPANPADVIRYKPAMTEISALTVVVSDVMNICGRKPELCYKFRSWIWHFGMRTFATSDPGQRKAVDLVRSTPLY